MKRVILTDIEGTTSSIHFVKEVLFPYADQAMQAYVMANAERPDVAEQLEATRREMGEPAATPQQIVTQLRNWIREDRKITPLKTLQGLIWEEGYRSGAFQAHIYPDAANALRQWHQQGHPLYVYSSGSIQAQRLFFAHTEAGDFTPLFSGYFDTTSGHKREAESYQRIAHAIGAEPNAILFLSDIVQELDAARACGMQTTWLVREGALPTDATHPVARSFADIAPA